ncbi:CHAT domain-containing protein [Aquimarina algiphila]|uniref:CHAT domain-containing protein n=1 Tax=Aquimarina algiphila TaxID=2047982 RepID=UPI00232A82A6|nr:CHAT domain-containing protein [Aquimarina algiphila]
MGATAQIKIDTTRASQYYKEADSLLIQKKYEESIALFNKALPEYKKAKAWEKVASCYNKVSNNYWAQKLYNESSQSTQQALEICNQYLPENHIEKAKAYDRIGNKIETTELKYTQAIEYYRKALAIKKTVLPKDHFLFTKSYKNLGVLYRKTGKYTNAIKYLKLNVDMYIKTYGKNHSKITSPLNDLSLCYLKMGESHLALKYTKESLAIIQKKYGLHSDKVAKFHFRLGSIYDDISDYKKAIFNFKKAIATTKKTNSSYLSQCYNNLGNLFSKTGEYKKSLNHFQKAIGYSKKTFHQNPINLFINYQNISLVYIELNDLDTAYQYITMLLSKAEKILGKDHFELVRAYNILALIYKKKKEFAKSLEIHNRSLRILQNVLGEDHSRVALAYDFLGDVYNDQKEYKKAIDYYKKAIIIREKNYGKHHRVVAMTYYSLSTSFFLENQLEDALKYLEKSNIANTYIDKTDINSDDRFVDVHFQVTILNQKAKIFYLKYLNNQNVDTLRKSIEIYKKADVIIHRIRQSYTDFQDKVSFSERVKDLYHGIITSQFELYKKTKDSKVLNELFYYVERSKANILMELLHITDANNFSDLPSEIIVLEKDLRIDRAYYQSQIAKAYNNQSIDSIKLNDYKNKLFDINKRQDSLIQFLDQDYPKYYQLKYQTSSIVISDIQQQLDHKTTLLEFFTGDSITYAFTISKNEIAVQELATPKLTKQVEQFRKSITSKHIGEFKKQSHLLYNALLTPVKEQLKGNELIIIPDGPLWHLNFELLLTQNDASEDPGELSYLLKDYAITHANSANLLFNPFKEGVSEDEKKGCLAFSFSDSTNITTSKNMSLATLRDTGDDLPGTRKEIRAIADIIDGQYYFGAEANEANFKKKADRYKILHLALHGEVDNEYPDNSKLFFTKSNDTIEDNLLYAHELFALHIPSELTVLSACNTGTGKIAKGEGIMSLGNAFQYAGTKSLLLSSWEVPDNTAPELMRYFYTNLKAGMHKGKALQQAKLQYLKTADRYHKDPFYWGGFYLVGDSAPIQFRNTDSWYWILGLGVLGMILMGLFLYKRKNYGRVIIQKVLSL